MRRWTMLVWALIGACTTVDLELPPAPERQAPVVEAIEPATGFAGQRLRITGRAFDPEPGGNEVHFPNASAVPVVSSETSLEVVVPDDAGPGPVFVSTAGGRSVGIPFGYRGLGHLRRGVEAARTVLGYGFEWISLHAGRTYALSKAFSRLVDIDADEVVRFPSPCEECPADDDVVGRPMAMPDGLRLLVPLSSGVVLFNPLEPQRVVMVAPRGEGLGAYHRSPVAGSQLVWRSIETLEPKVVEVTLLDSRGFSVVRRGRFSGVGEVVPVDDGRFFLFDDARQAYTLHDFDGTAPWSPGELVDASLLLVVDGTLPQAFAIGRKTQGLVEVSLTSLPSLTVHPMAVRSDDVWSATLAEGAEGPIVVLGLAWKGIVAAVDAHSGAFLWSSESARQPGALAVDAQRRVVLVSDDASRDVVALDLRTGGIASRQALRPPLGLANARGHGPQGLAYAKLAGGAAALVALPRLDGRVRDFDARLMEFGDGAGLPLADALYPTSEEGVLAYSAAAGRLATLDLAQEYAVRSRPEALARDAGGTLVVAREGLFVDAWLQGAAGAPSASWQGDRAGAEAAEFFDLRARAGGGWTAARRLTTTEAPASMQLLVWALGALESGGAPASERTFVGCDGVLPVPGGYELLCDEGRLTVGDGLEVVASVSAADESEQLSRYSVVSPDGTMAVSWEVLESWLHAYRLAPGRPLVRIASIPVPWPVAAMRFAPDGETLLVVAEDAVVRVE
jgi:hypothetical protein